MKRSLSLPRTVFLLSAIAMACAHLHARDWKQVDGGVVSGEFAGRVGDIVFIKKADGTRVKVPVANLSPEDQGVIRERQNSTAVSVVKTDKNVENALLKARQAQAQQVLGAVLFGHKLVVPSGEGFADAPGGTTAPEYYAIYFSAGWCGPCQQFTPRLVEFYRAHKDRHPNFEVVFVSSDRSEREMLSYMKRYSMPWPAVRFEDAKAADIGKYAGNGIPCLVVVDAQGKVLYNSYERGQYVGPQQPMAALGKLLASK